MDPLQAALERVLRTGSRSVSDFPTWWERELQLRGEFPHPGARAVVLAAESARLGLAFAGGFRAALARLGSLCEGSDGLTELGGRRVAFCATEAGGAHPRAIATSLEPEGADFRIRGEKSWATLGEWAEELLVVCRRGARPDGRPDLALVRVDVAQPGVERVEAQATPFCPEITHCGFRLDVLVRADQVLPGDGYTDYLKPFRTVEDGFVQLAVCAYLLGVARRLELGVEWQEVWSALLLSAWEVSKLDPRRSATHSALAGLEQLMAERRDAFERVWETQGGAEWSCWERDRGLLRVARQAREARREAARRQMATRGADPHA